MKTQITKMVGNEYQGKTNYTVTLSDGTVGYLQDKTSDDGLKEGDFVDVVIEDYTSKAGKQSKLVSLKKVQQQEAPSSLGVIPQRPTINVGAGKSKHEMKAEATIRVAEVLVGAFGEGKLESAQVSVNVKEYGRLLWSEIDEIYSQ